MSDADPFAGSVSLPSISFATKDAYGNLASKPVGTRIGGRVLKTPSLVQRRNFTTKLAEFWPDGNPKMSVVVDMNVDGEDMSLWVKKPSQLFKAFGEAIEAAGSVPVAPGSQIYVNLVGFEKPEGDNAPAKVYRVDYTPASAFNGQGVATNGAAPASKPMTAEGYTLESLLAAGWSAQQIAAAYPILVPPAPAPAPPPPAPAPPAPAPPVAAAPPPPAAAPAPPLAPPSQSERDARIAAMTPEDRALLGI